MFYTLFLVYGDVMNRQLENLNSKVHDIKEKEKSRLLKRSENTSNMIVMFESNKDFFLHSLNCVRLKNQYDELIHLLMRYSGLKQGEFDEEEINRVFRNAGVFPVSLHKKILFVLYYSAWIAIITYLYFNVFEAYKIELTVCVSGVAIILYAFFYIMYMGSYVRFFFIKSPDKWK